MHVSYFLWGIIFQTKLSKLIKLRKFLLLFFFYISNLQALLSYIFIFFQQIDKHGSHFHNMLKVFSFSQIVFFMLLSFCNSLFSHFFLLISFYPYIGLFHSISLYFGLYILFHFFCFVPLNNPTKPKNVLNN